MSQSNEAQVGSTAVPVAPITLPTPISAQPLIFISHRHIDRDLAIKVADWLKVATTGNVDIFLSSDGLLGTEVARSITDQIRVKVAQAAIMFTVYTDEEADWAWVMFEMGIAMDPNTPVTKVIVLQCGPEGPRILPDFKRVKMGLEDDRVGLVRDIFSEGFFPTHPNLKLGGPKVDEEVLRAQAAQLWDQVSALISPPDATRKQQWWPYPWIRIEVPLATLGDLSPVNQERMEGFRLPIKLNGIVIQEESISSIFSVNSFIGKKLVDLEALLELHKQGSWIDTCVDHLAHCLVDSMPTESTVSVRGINDRDHLPLVQRVQHKWFEKAVRFDVMFIPATRIASPIALSIPQAQ
jgi:hypothetical protein